MAKQRAQQFDAQAALERKTNEALKLAKAQAHIHDDKDEPMEPATGAPLVDCMFCVLFFLYLLTVFCSGFGRAQLPKSHFAEWATDNWTAQYVDGPTQGVSIEGIKLVGDALRAGNQWYPCR